MVKGTEINWTANTLGSVDRLHAVKFRLQSLLREADRQPAPLPGTHVVELKQQLGVR